MNELELNSLELNFQWVRSYNMIIVSNKLYAVRNELCPNNKRAVAIAYRTITGDWQITSQIPVPFKVVYVCHIEKVTDTFINGPFAIGDRVELLESIDDYEIASTGEIVGKFDLSRVWCLRMQDNFVILVKDHKFKNITSMYKEMARQT